MQKQYLPGLPSGIFPQWCRLPPLLHRLLAMLEQRLLKVCGRLFPGRHYLFDLFVLLPNLHRTSLFIMSIMPSRFLPRGEFLLPLSHRLCCMHGHLIVQDLQKCLFFVRKHLQTVHRQLQSMLKLCGMPGMHGRVLYLGVVLRWLWT